MTYVNSSLSESFPESIKGEEWRNVIGFNGQYHVSSLGRIRNENRRILYPCQSAKNPYPRVSLTKNGKARKWRVHVLVAAAFIGPCPSGCEINHIDGIKTNAAAVNLEYLTPNENKAHASAAGLLPKGEFNGNSKLTPSTVRQIFNLAYEELTLREIGKRIGVCAATVHNVLKGKTWRHVSSLPILASPSPARRTSK